MGSGPLRLLAVLVVIKTGFFQQLNPSQQNIAHVGGTATFTCSGTTSADPPISITWNFTNSDLMNNSSNNVVEQFNPNIQIGRLTIHQLLPSYNGSQISCRVLLSGSVVTSNPSRLLILEIHGLTAVTMQQDEIITLNWTSSLNMLSDVSYCVEAINTTSSKQLVAVCNITTTEYIYPYLEPSRVNCTSIDFIVTPVIQGVGNGTVISALFEPQVILPQLVNASEPTYSTDPYTFVTYTFQMSATVCHAEVIIVDSGIKDAIPIVNDVTISGVNIIVTAQLMMNRHYTVSITAYNSAGRKISEILIKTPVSNSELETNSNAESGENVQPIILAVVVTTTTLCIAISVVAAIIITKTLWHPKKKKKNTSESIEMKEQGVEDEQQTKKVNNKKQRSEEKKKGDKDKQGLTASYQLQQKKDKNNCARSSKTL